MTRTWAGVAALVLSGGLLAGCQTGGPSGGAQQFTQTEPVESQSVTLRVNGLSCPLCAQNVDKQLRRVVGVKTVDVDLGAGEVHVGMVGDLRPSPRQLAKAVRDAGFTLVRIDTP